MRLISIFAAGAALVALASPAFAGDMAKKDSAKADRAAPTSDIIDTAVAAGSFNTLVAAVKAAGLEETLRSKGPFTVFAPTDEAFAALPAGTVENLLKPENKSQLAAILTYHVLAGKVKSKEIAGKTLQPATVNGATLNVDATSGVKVNASNVIKADIYTTNGVIHVIDAVLLPPAAQ
jgi:uncharacterized surface protein with fasciclin (FAS1) repeats